LASEVFGGTATAAKNLGANQLQMIRSRLTTQAGSKNVNGTFKIN